MMLSLANLPKPEAEAAYARVRVSLTTVALCFDGQQLCVLLGGSGSGTAGATRLPALPHGGTRSLDDVTADALGQMGIHAFTRVRHVDAFEDKGQDGLGGIDIVTLSVCKPLSSIARNDKDAEATKSIVNPGAVWLPIAHVADLSHDVRARVEGALASLRQKARFEGVAFDFLHEEFSLSELQRVFEAILGKTIDVRNFRKKIESLGILTESPNKPRGMAYRPPRVFRFDSTRFRQRVLEDGEIRFF